ncbi:MAG TPA: peptidylprolyl isomerase [Desulfatiglandales bacterium]|nr:peptidylprolyl isomerase [Desulfatiglandales bacterium]
MRTFIISIFCIMTMLGSTSRVSAEITNRLVAFVNNDVITLYELEKRIGEMTGRTPKDIRAQDEQRYIEIRQVILEELINDKIAKTKIDELGVKVSEGEIDSYIENIKTENRVTQEELIEQLKAEGLTYEKFRAKIKEDLERNQLIDYEVKSKTIVREEQIIKYYQDNIKDFGTEGQVYLAGIFLMQNNPDNKEELAELEKKGEMILSRLKNGEDFSILAKEFSQGPGVDEGGDLGAFNTSQINQDMLDILEKLPEGGISDLIKRENNIQIIKLIKRDRVKTKSLEEVRDSIYEKLYSEEVNKRYTSWLKELRESCFTKIVF